MSMFVQQSYTLELCGDGTSTSCSFDLAKAPFASGFNGSHAALSIGNPTSVVSVGWQATPQIGYDANNNPIFDTPTISSVTVQGVATLNMTFGSALKAFNSVFTDGQGNPWTIGNYTILVEFRYNG